MADQCVMDRGRNFILPCIKKKKTQNSADLISSVMGQASAFLKIVSVRHELRFWGLSS